MGTKRWTHYIQTLSPARLSQRSELVFQELDMELSKKDVAIGVIVGVLVWAGIMICLSWQCQKGLMREWYKLKIKKEKMDFQQIYDS